MSKMPLAQITKDLLWIPMVTYRESKSSRTFKYSIQRFGYAIHLN